MDSQPTQRFSSRVEDYVRYRPDYPAGVISLLEREIGLTPGWIVADIGSGPGNLTRRFLDLGTTIYGVEPNDAMRKAGEALMANDENFISIEGQAESTTLPDSSVNLVVAGQAFHWFDPAPTRIEFQRILTAPGWVALIWNRRSEAISPMLEEYHEMLRTYSTDYDQVSVRDERTGAGMQVLFGDASIQEFVLPHEQRLNAESFWGRLRSSSYTPLAGQPGHDEISKRSSEIFASYAQDGLLHFPYETQIYLGKVLPSN